MTAHIKDDIINEQREREQAEDTLLKLLEQTCLQLNYKSKF